MTATVSVLATLFGTLLLGWFKNAHTVPDGQAGAIFRKGKARCVKVRRRWWRIWDLREILGKTLYTDEIRLYRSGKLALTVPGLDKLRFLQEKERNTDDTTISVTLKSGDVLLGRFIMTYDLAYAGVVMALCTAPTNFDSQVSTFFQGVVAAVVRESSALDDSLEAICDRIRTAAQANPDLRAYGVVPTRITTAEYTPSPQTQLGQILERLADRVGVPGLLQLMQGHRES